MGGRILFHLGKASNVVVYSLGSDCGVLQRPGCDIKVAWPTGLGAFQVVSTLSVSDVLGHNRALLRDFVGSQPADELATI